MNLFTKAYIVRLLDRKIKMNEIKSYQLNNTSLHIKKSKRTKYTIDIKNISSDVLIKLLNKRIPDASQINIADFVKRELRDIKIRELVNN